MPKKYPFTQVQLVTWICPKIGDMLAGSIFYISTSDGHLFDFSCIPGLFPEKTIKCFGDYATPCDPAWRDTNLFLEGRFSSREVLFFCILCGWTPEYFLVKVRD
jgi:hypothetical protein